MNIYQDRLLSYYRDERYRMPLDKPDIVSAVANPSCGDAISMQAMLIKDRLGAVRYQAKGCVISQAAAALLCEYAENKTINEVLAMNADTMVELIQMPLGPNRLRCALLALEALQQGINNAQSSCTH